LRSGFSSTAQIKLYVGDVVTSFSDSPEAPQYTPQEIIAGVKEANPNQPVAGLQSLLVNGELVVDGGELILDAAPGRPIRRTAPTR
jgi:hypothetical protein